MMHTATTHTFTQVDAAHERLESLTEGGLDEHACREVAEAMNEPDATYDILTVEAAWISTYPVEASVKLSGLLTTALARFTRGETGPNQSRTLADAMLLMLSRGGLDPVNTYIGPRTCSIGHALRPLYDRIEALNSRYLSNL